MGAAVGVGQGPGPMTGDRPPTPPSARAEAEATTPGRGRRPPEGREPRGPDPGAERGDAETNMPFAAATSASSQSPETLADFVDTFWRILITFGSKLVGAHTSLYDI